jgi:hypothetical protein
MIGYCTLGTNDLPRAGKFYDTLFADIGGKRFMETDRSIAWMGGPASGGFGVCKPFDGKPATVGNGVMVAVTVDSKAKVDALYKKAMQLGGKDEGAPDRAATAGFTPRISAISTATSSMCSA